MSIKLLTEHHLEFLSLKRGCTGSSESTLIKMPHCWKSHVRAQMIQLLNWDNFVPASGERLRDLNILIGKTQDNWSLCDYYAGPALPGEELLIKCPQPMTGRYVKLQKVDNTDALCLCEVEVMGRPGTHGIF